MNESAAVFSTLTFFLVLIAIFRLATLDRRLATLSRVEAKLDALIRHAGIQFDPYEFVQEGVAESLKRGHKIEAIKRYREGTGATLKDAKDFVDELERRAVKNHV